MEHGTPAVLWLISVTLTLSNAYAYFPSDVYYGVIFFGNSFNSGKIFKLQKEIFRMMVTVQLRSTYRRAYKQLKFLPLTC